MSTDIDSIQRWTMGLVATAAVIASVGVISVVHLQEADGPAEFSPYALPQTFSGIAPVAIPISGQGDLASPSAAEELDLDAQYQMGLGILQRSWERDDQSELNHAKEWIAAAADSGHIRAKLVLGILYETGRGVIQDYDEAIVWYRRAANEGDPQAMARLGQMLVTGRGIDKDLVEGYVWLNLAAARGDKNAVGDRNRLQNLLSADQLRQAQGESRKLDKLVPRILVSSRLVQSDS